MTRSVVGWRLFISASLGLYYLNLPRQISTFTFRTAKYIASVGYIARRLQTAHYTALFIYMHT